MQLTHDATNNILRSNCPCCWMQVSIVIEQLVRLLLHCGMPRTDLDLLHGQGTAMHAVLMDAKPRSTLFTGSQRVAERLAIDLAGKVCGGWCCRCCWAPLEHGAAEMQTLTADKAGDCAGSSCSCRIQCVQPCNAWLMPCQVTPNACHLPPVCFLTATPQTLCTAQPTQVFLEDAGFDWKLLGPDVAELDYVAWQCDQDAYACSGQKCSAQSIMFAHTNWVKAGLLDRLKVRGW
jgi:hypothetical protein